MTRRPLPATMLPDSTRRLINALNETARALEFEAAEYAIHGGGWGLMLAGEVGSSAGQLRWVATCLLRSHTDPDPADAGHYPYTDADAELWLIAAFRILEDIRTANHQPRGKLA